MAQPIYKTKNGQFSAAIFENPKGKSISLQKGYTDKEGNWQNQSITLFPRHVDTIIGLLQEAKKQCESTDEPAPEEGAASSSSKLDKFGNKREEIYNLPGGDELIIEEEEEIADEGDRSEMEEFIEEDEMAALEIWNRCDDVEAD